MIPKGREFYLECAKLSSDRKYQIECLKNFVRVLNKEKGRPTRDGPQRKKILISYHESEDCTL